MVKYFNEFYVFPMEEKGGTMKLLIVGNIAYDTICKVRFLPSKNEATSIEDLKQTFGGCAGNVAMITSKLGIDTSIFSIVGEDFKESDYLRHLIKHKIDVSNLKYSPRFSTAKSFLFTDNKGNQQIFYYPGASSELINYKLDPSEFHYIHFAAGEISAYPDIMRNAKHSIISFDPGQEMFHRPVEKQILPCLPYVSYLFLNNHEADLLLKVTGEKSLENLRLDNSIRAVIVSYGKKGSEIYFNGKRINIPAVGPKKILDPTGAGDAHRAGFLASLIKGYDLAKCGRIASVVASFIIEKYGTQTNIPSWNMIKRRYAEFFKETLE
ncbi:MAG: carbohydrate kinase family protein [Thermoplasmata archaeon]|nr:MAG: carbohydrate kinase family protein [Thermoplasmata archaeon]HDO70274.1 carbohydrate kinase family protein [Thermoplasmatales archaeon]HEX08638.1 carbohydrate kinase family protein [Thermoplasmatales archaeon]